MTPVTPYSMREALQVFVDAAIDAGMPAADAARLAQAVERAHHESVDVALRREREAIARMSLVSGAASAAIRARGAL